MPGGSLELGMLLRATSHFGELMRSSGDVSCETRTSECSAGRGGFFVFVCQKFRLRCTVASQRDIQRPSGANEHDFPANSLRYVWYRIFDDQNIVIIGLDQADIDIGKMLCGRGTLDKQSPLPHVFNCT